MTKQDILNYIEENAGCTAPELEANFNMDPEAGQLLNQLIVEGKVLVDANWVLSIAP